MKCPTSAASLRFVAVVLFCAAFALLAHAQNLVAPPTITNAFGAPTLPLNGPAVFAGRGSVTGTVFDGLQHPVAGASVTLISGSVFGGGGTVATDSQGHYSFAGVAVGPFTINASHAGMRLAGQASGKLLRSGDQVNGDLTLGPSATVTGTVREPNGAVPAGNAQVVLSNGLSTVADSNGNYTFNFVPLGKYSIASNDPAGAHHGTGEVALSAQDQTQIIDVALGKSRAAMTTTLTFRIANPNAGAPLSEIGFNDMLPDGLLVASPSNLAGDCAGAGAGTIDAVAGSHSVSLSGLALAASASCSFSVNVTGIQAGLQNSSTGPISARESGVGTASNIIGVIVVSPPSITKSFSAATAPLNTSVTLTFTITNPNGATDLTGVSFNDTLPSGLIIANPDSLVGTCDPGVITPAVTSINLVGGTILAGSSCTFSIDVLAIAGGTQVNTTDPVTSNEGGTGNTATATVDVPLPDLTVTKTHTGTFSQGQAGATYTITVTNVGGATTNATVNVADTLPAGLTATAISGTGWTCLTLTSCFRADGLDPGLSFPDITLTVTVALKASGTLTNMVTVSGGGEANTTNNTASDPTTITPLVGAPLSITPQAGSTSVTVSAGSPATLVFTVTSGSPTLGPIIFGCVGLPARASCSFDNQGETQSTATVTLTITTVATSASAAPFSLGHAAAFYGIALFPLLGLSWICAGRRKSRKAWLWTSLFLVGLLLLSGLAGCGGKGPQSGLSPSGVFAVSVTATSTNIPSVQAVTTVTLNLK